MLVHLLGRAGVMIGSLAMMISFATTSVPVLAENEGPVAVLKAMTDYVKGQDNISVVADTDIEVVTWRKT